jgi:hypothetical protein
MYPESIPYYVCGDRYTGEDSPFILEKFPFCDNPGFKTGIIFVNYSVGIYSGLLNKITPSTLLLKNIETVDRSEMATPAELDTRQAKRYLRIEF